MGTTLTLLPRSDLRHRDAEGPKVQSPTLSPGVSHRESGEAGRSLQGCPPDLSADPRPPSVEWGSP